MKKRVFCLILVLTIILSALISCRDSQSNSDGGSVSNGGNVSNGGDVSDVGEGVIYSPKVSINVVVPSGEEVEQELYDSFYTVYETVCDLTGGYHFYVGDHQEDLKKEREIVIGNTNREISNKALDKFDVYFSRALDNIDDPTFVKGYGVYAFGGSVALVWTDEIAAQYAIDYFVGNYLVSDTLSLEDGFFDFQTFDYIEVLREEERIERENALTKVAEIYGDDTVNALKTYLSIFDERFYLWLADLYDPGEYDEYGNPLGGGFYYSNSARNDPWYGIDLESTYQAMDFIQNMVKDASVVKEILPESMYEQMAAFAISCQSPIDGYFYHPQWGTNITVQRRGRDLDWAKRLLTLCEKSPRWDAPNGMKGIEGAPPGVMPVSMLTEPLSSSITAAVSKIISTSSAWTGDSNLATLSKWESYVKSYEATIHNNSYYIGNTFASMASQIKNRDNLAIQNGELKDSDNNGIADGGYIEIWQKYFDLWQVPSNGTWSNGVSGQVTYGAVNGLMKISSVYNTLGIKMNYSDKAFVSALSMATLIGIGNKGEDWADASEKKPNEVVDVYNPISSMVSVLENVDNFGTDTESEVLDNILKANAADLVNATARKVAMFKKNDGSFGYTWTTVPHASQGAPVAVRGTVEGDVNGGTIAVNLMTYLMSMLEISYSDRKAIQPYVYSDLLVFAQRIRELDVVVKDPYKDPSENIYHFDDEAPGSFPGYVTRSFVNGSAEIVADEADPENENKYLNLYAVSGTSGNRLFFTAEKIPNNTCMVAEWDMKITDVEKNIPSALQISILPSYILTVSVNDDGTFTLGDMSGYKTTSTKNTFDAKFECDEWNHIRLESYIPDYEENIAVTYIYVNDYLRFTSKNYYLNDEGASPSLDCTELIFLATASTDLTLSLDNVKVYKSLDTYIEKETTNPDRIKHFDNLEVGGEKLPVDVTASGGEIQNIPSSENSKNNAIVIDKPGENVSVLAIKSKTQASCYAAYMKLKISSVQLGEIAKIRLTPKETDDSILAYKLEVYEDADARYARLVELKCDGSFGNSYSGLKTDEWIEIGIEFYPYFYNTEVSSILYLNGKELGRGNTYYDKDTLSLDYISLVITSESDSPLAIDDIISEAIVKSFVNSDGETLTAPNVFLPEPGNCGNGDYYTNDAYPNDSKYSYDNIESATTDNVIHSGTVNGNVSGGGNIDIRGRLSFQNGSRFGLKNSGAKTGAAYIFETDLFVASGKVTKTGDQIAWFGMSASGHDKTTHFVSLGLYYTADSNGNITSISVKDYVSGSVLAELAIDKWQNVRAEYIPSDTKANQGTVIFYLDGVVKSVYETKGYGDRANVSNLSLECVGFEFRGASYSGANTTYRLDNTVITALSVAPQIPEVPKPQEPTPDEDLGDPAPDAPTADGRGNGVYYRDTDYSSNAKYHYNALTSVTKNNYLTSGSFTTSVGVVDGTLTFTGGIFALRNRGDLTGEKYVFETDIYFSATTATKTSDNIMWIGMSSIDAGVQNGKQSSFVNFSLYYTTDENLNVTGIIIKNTMDLATVATLSVNKWQNIRVEYTPIAKDGGKVDFYLDDVLVKSYTTWGYGSGTRLNEEFESLSIEIRSSSSSGAVITTKFDNTFISAITEGDTDFEEPGEGGGDSPVADGKGSGVYYNDTAYLSSSKYSYNGITSVTTSDHLTSGSTTTSVGVPDDTLTFSGGRFALKNGGDLTGDKYIFETDVYFAVSTATKTTDNIMWMGMSSVDAGVTNGKESSFVNFSFYYTTDENLNVTGIIIKNSIDLTTVATLSVNKWQNIRVEYTPIAKDGGKIEFYLDNELVKSYTTWGYGSGTRLNEEFESLSIEVRNSSYSGVKITTKFDNTFMSAITEEE